MAPIQSAPRAIVVTDMSGFTRITRQYGIVHMISLIWKTRQVVRALFVSYGATRITFEADNVLAAFPDPAKALAAALQVQAVIDEQNSASDESLAITMGSVGVGYGHIVDEPHLFSGQEFSDAFLLGEDVANKREVAVTDAVRQAVITSDLFTDLAFDPREDDEYHDGKVSYYVATGKIKKPFDFKPDELAAITEDGAVAESLGMDKGHKLVSPFAVPLLKRFTSDASQRDVIDKQLQDRFFIDATVLMYGANWDAAVAKGVGALRQAKQKALEIVNNVVPKHGGLVEEPTLFVFKDVVNAFLASLELREAMLEASVPVTGFGVHIGKLLFVQGTEVHQGDPVNTASKLAEDYASKHSDDSPVLLSDAFYKQVQEVISAAPADGERAKVVRDTHVKEISLQISGVSIPAVAVE